MRIEQKKPYEIDKAIIFDENKGIDKVTDFAILTGEIYYIDYNSTYYFQNIQLCLRYTSLDRYNLNALKKYNYDIFEIEYGYYPQSAVSKEKQIELNQAFNLHMMNPTRKVYTVDYENIFPFNTRFIVYNEYEYNGRYYIRFKVEREYGGKFSKRNKKRLSNGEKYEIGDFVWIEVQPVKWLVDKRRNNMVTDKFILPGIQYIGEYDELNKFRIFPLKKFVNEYLSSELFRKSSIARISDSNKRKADSNKRKATNVVVPYNIEIKGIDKIFKYEKALESQSEIVVNKFSELVQGENDSRKREKELQESIEKFLKEFKKTKPNFKRKNNFVNRNFGINEELIENLKNYLEEKGKVLYENIENHQKIKKEMVSYLKESREYLNILNTMKQELDEEIINKEYAEMDFNIYDDRFKQVFLQNKIESITIAVTQILQLYQKLVLKINTYLETLNYIELSRKTALQIYATNILEDNFSEEKEDMKLIENISKIFNDITDDNIGEENINTPLNDKSKMLINEILTENEKQPVEETNVKIKKKV